MTHNATTPAQLLRLPDVTAITGLSRSTIYRLSGAGEFPKGRRMTARTTAWVSSEVAAWIDARIAIP